MAQTGKYRGTTVTEFCERHSSLLVALALFLGLTLFVSAQATTLLGLALALFSFCVTFILWLALLYQCAQARPLTALMELFALVLLFGFVAVLVAAVLAWWRWRFVVLPVVFYLSLFLLLDESGLSRRRIFAARARARIGLRLFCLLLAVLLGYLLKSL